METANLAAPDDAGASATDTLDGYLTQWRLLPGLDAAIVESFGRQIAPFFSHTSEVERVLRNLDSFLRAVPEADSPVQMIKQDAEALPALLHLFSASQHFSEQLIRTPEIFQELRKSGGQPVQREAFIRQVVAEVLSSSDERSQMLALRRIKQREMLRIAYGDLVRQHSLEVVARQISYLAESLVEAAVAAARRKLQSRQPQPVPGNVPRFAVIALGKLGGQELNYSSDIDLVFVCDGVGGDAKRVATMSDYFERLARQVVKLLGDTELGAVYRVDLRLRPHGSGGAIVLGLEDTLFYYDVHGRTWERQAFVKARTIAGDLDLGQELLQQLEPWIYRRYLSRADISGVQALKRRIEHRAEKERSAPNNVKTGRGGLRDIEFVIQFLQLLNGGDLPEIRTTNTLEAIRRLESAGCLTPQERTILEDSYTFLRKLEHRLQIMFDLQTHSLPDGELELQRLATRMDYVDGTTLAIDQLRSHYAAKTEVNRRILDHLLHSAFPNADAAPEVDLVLDPDPSRSTINDVLGPYNFLNLPQAYDNLMTLATEKVPFISTRRCRHFLAGIAQRLLRAIARTPDPDFTLRTLSRVSDSLGGKGVLWELFSFHPPTLELYVRLCACSPYLADVLTSSPGMIDELLDSLLLDKLPSFESIQATLTELCRGAVDLEPILLSFKGSMHLRVGVRDILGKEEITATHRALSDIMEVILARVAQHEYERLVSRYGEPIVAEGPKAGEVCELVIVALGKFGGREPNYHSDADIVFLYEGDGTTQHRGAKGKETTTNGHFFGQLAQRIIKVVTQLGPQGRLYQIDARLRPVGNAGPLAISLSDFERYHASGQAQLWERQTLCKARAIYGSQLARIKTMHAIRQAILQSPWQSHFTAAIRDIRHRMEEQTAGLNLKRGPGGAVDVEFVVQLLQLKHAAKHNSVLVPGTLEAITTLRDAGVMTSNDAAWWSESYLFLRRVESGLRLLNTTARHDLPGDRAALRRLAYLLGTTAERLEGRCYDLMQENRRRFLQVFEA